MNPNIFVVFGMPRTGTTYLYHALQSHPDIFIPYRKESYYFSVNYRKGPEWYESLFENIGARQLGADINPLYYLDDRAIGRMRDYHPQMKVVLGVRRPDDFAISLYGNMVALGFDVPPILEVASGYFWQLTPEEGFRFDLSNRFLESRVQELQDAFGDNLLLYDFKGFNESPLRILKALEQFLGISEYYSEDNYEKTRINASNRRNLPLLNALISSQRVLDLAYAVTPKPVVRKVRSLFDRLSASGSEKSRAPRLVTDADRQQLSGLLASDLSFYERLFEASTILVGNKPFHGGD